MSKRPAEDDIPVVVSDSEDGAAAKPAKKAKKEGGKEKAAKKADKKEDKEKKEKAPPKPKVVKLKPFTPEEEVIAAGASMARNAQILEFVNGICAAYKESAEWFKLAAAKKAAAALAAHDKPIRVAAELGALTGFGKGTIEKVQEFLKGLGKPGEGYAAEAAAAATDAGKDAQWDWLKDSDKATVLDLVASGGAPKEQAIAWHPDITEVRSADCAEVARAQWSRAQ
jgi:TPR repeat protein